VCGVGSVVVLMLLEFLFPAWHHVSDSVFEARVAARLLTQVWVGHIPLYSIRQAAAAETYCPFGLFLIVLHIWGFDVASNLQQSNM